MRRNILSFCAALLACSALTACADHKAAVDPALEQKQKDEAARAARPKSPHNVMISLAGGAPLSRDQQPYVISLQDKIADRWQPIAAKLKYSVGIEFTLTRPGLTSNVTSVSSMGTRKAVESCKDAILRADRFDPLPAQFKESPQTFLCEFIYNPQTDSAGATTTSTTSTSTTAGANTAPGAASK